MSLTFETIPYLPYFQAFFACHIECEIIGPVQFDGMNVCTRRLMNDSHLVSNNLTAGEG